MQIPDHKDVLAQAARQARSELARQGGQARQAAMSQEERKALAAKALQIRWGKDVEERAKRKAERAKGLAEIRAQKHLKKRKPKIG